MQGVRSIHENERSQHQIPIRPNGSSAKSAILLQTTKLTLSSICAHTGEKPYVCDFEGCAHRCGHSGGLTTHRRTHTGEKPYACDFEGCGFACTTRYGLAAHKRAHTGDRPFRCDMCEFASTTKSDLIKHKRKHTGERPYSCKFPMCGFASSASGGLSSHTASMHTQEGKVRQKKAERRVELALQRAGYTQLAASGVKPPRMHFKREMHIDFKCVGDIDGKFAWILCLQPPLANWSHWRWTNPSIDSVTAPLGAI